MARTAALKFDEIGYWSEIKLDIVKKYAAAYSRILSKHRFEHVYIDAFSGAGIHLSKTSGDFVPGSPINALYIEPPFREYHFIDLNPQKTAHLQELIGEKPGQVLFLLDNFVGCFSFEIDTTGRTRSM